MRDKITYLLIICIFIATAINLVNMQSIKTDIEEFDNKIEEIGKEIDSISDLNAELDNKIESLHTEIELIDGDINRVQTNITTIKENTNEKVRTITLFGDDELELFFAEWARQHKDSID